MKIRISQIGNFAQEVLGRSKGARVSGIASRGFYLQPENDLTIYLSLEEFPGPLTLNLEEVSSRLETRRLLSLMKTVISGIPLRSITR